MAKDKICGIYRIENLINHKSYIGQSVDIYKRWQEHIWALDNKYHNNKHLMRAWHKYKEHNFQFTIIKQCKENELNKQEIFWIDYYDAYYNGYNQTKGGDGCSGKVWTEEERAKISRAVLQISLDGYIIGRFINIDEAGNQTGVDRRGIWNCANKHYTVCCRNGKEYKHFAKTAGGYIWVYEDEMDSFDLLWYQDNKVCYKAYQYDLNWNLLKEWPSVESVKQIGYQPTTVRGVCQGKYMSAYGYLWTYAIDDLDEYILWYHKHFDVKYIGQYDKENNLLKVWNTAEETKRDGFNSALVREVLRGKFLTHRKYMFKYITLDELKNINWKGQLNYEKL